MPRALPCATRRRGARKVYLRSLSSCSPVSRPGSQEVGEPLEHVGEKVTSSSRWRRRTPPGHSARRKSRQREIELQKSHYFSVAVR